MFSFEVIKCDLLAIKQTQIGILQWAARAGKPVYEL